jgi:hypothetical protein
MPLILIEVIKVIFFSFFHLRDNNIILLRLYFILEAVRSINLRFFQVKDLSIVQEKFMLAYWHSSCCYCIKQ